MTVSLKGTGQAASRTRALDCIAKGLEKSSADRECEKTERETTTLKTSRGLPLDSQGVASKSNNAKRHLHLKEENVRKAKKAIDDITKFIAKVEAEKIERADSYWSIVQGFPEASRQNSPKQVIEVMVKLFIRDEKVRALIRKEKSVQSMRDCLVTELNKIGIDKSQAGFDSRLERFKTDCANMIANLALLNEAVDCLRNNGRESEAT